MTDPIFSAEDHARVTAAVASAERETDGEIVTIVSARSDGYRDVAIHYAILAMLLVVALLAAIPGLAEAKLAWLDGGWNSETNVALLLLLVLVGQAVAFLIVRYALEWAPMRMALTPRGTKSRRVRRRAVELFKASAEKRTEHRVGILLYLSLAEHRAEIVADAAIHSKVPAERWGDAMAALVDEVRRGDPAGGMVAAVGLISQLLAEHFPKTAADTNELPDRLIEL